MAAYKLSGLRVGQIMTNCYLMCNTDTKELLIVDPGDEADRIARKITETGCMPKAILLTHGHYDHVLAVSDLKTRYDIPVYMSQNDKQTLQDPSIARMFGGKMLQGAQIDRYLDQDEDLSLAGFEIKVLATPGHTPGGVCYYFPNEGVLFSGDTLFQGSIGRTDFPGGSYAQLIRSVESKLFVLPESVKVYPGHENETTIAFEKQYNPYF